MSEEITRAVEQELEEQARVAHELHARVVGRVRAIRREWIYLAAELHEFFRIEGWRALGHASKEAYLASPELGISRTQAYRLVEGYRELVIERQVEVDRLARLDSSTVWEVLPAIRRGQVEPDKALADCEVLGQMDLREEYRKLPATQAPGERRAIEPDDFHYENCPTCGSRIRVRD